MSMSKWSSLLTLGALLLAFFLGSLLSRQPVDEMKNQVVEAESTPESPEQKAANIRRDAGYKDIRARLNKLKEETPNVLELAVKHNVCALHDRIAAYEDLDRRLTALYEDPWRVSEPCYDCGRSYHREISQDIAYSSMVATDLAYAMMIAKEEMRCPGESRADTLQKVLTMMGKDAAKADGSFKYDPEVIRAAQLAAK